MLARTAILVMLVVMIGSASADPKQDARKHVETADIAYKLGQFDQALADYTAAYELYPVPALLFNIGQCHRNLKHFEQALFFYRGFLRDSPPDASGRDVVEDLIRDTQAALDKQHADEAAARQREDQERQQRDAQQRQAAEEAAARARIDEERRIAEARAQLQARPVAEPPIYKRWWFWPVVGGAAIAVGGTIVFATSSTKYVDPTGTLGGLDRR